MIESPQASPHLAQAPQPGEVWPEEAHGPALVAWVEAKWAQASAASGDAPDVVGCATFC